MTETTIQLSNVNLERALLYSLYIRPESLRLVDLTEEDFFDHRHRVIYRTMREMNQRGAGIDLETINDRLAAAKDLDTAGGFVYLVDLFNQIGIYGLPADYAQPILDLATRRRALRLAQDLARSVLDLKTEIAETLNKYGADIPRLVRATDGAQPIGFYAERHYERMSEASQNPDEARKRILKTGMLDFDEATLGGLRLGEMMLLLGKPGLGKTKWVHQVAAKLAENGHPGAVFQCETSEEEIMDREISRATRIPSERLEVAELREQEWPLYVNAIERASRIPLFLHFGAGWNTTTLRAELTRLKAEHKIQFFVFDYLRFLGDTFGKDETERENHISIRLKTICRELDIAGVVIHSMNKSGFMAASPDLEHSSGGAGISFDCDKALFMTEHVPEFDGDPVRPDYRTFVFRKSRRRLKFKVFTMQAMKDYPAFVDIAKPEQKGPRL